MYIDRYHTYMMIIMINVHALYSIRIYIEFEDR